MGERIEAKYDPSYGIGFRLGGGIIFNDKVSIAIDYYALGKHDINVDVSYPDGTSENYDGEYKVDILTLKLGLHF
jgi:hypothetical protein